ncbi:MAG TPA: hypothetical protein DCE44_21470, partial [Verrucomicrobiales bacterium]|nr:hypothetical protein [Verrucomicrobiales bacterium]
AKWVKRQPLLAGLTVTVTGAVMIGLFGNYFQYRRGEKLVEDGFQARQEANLSQAQLQVARANEMLATGNTTEGLAVLAAAVRRAPTHQPVVERLLSALPGPRGPVPATHPFVHSSAVLGADFSPTRDLVVTACADGMISLWHSRSGRLLHTLSRQQSPVTSVCFSPDGTRVVAGAKDGTVLAINVARFLLEREAFVHSGPIQAVAFTPDGRAFVTASKEGRATVRNSETGRIQFSIHHDPGIQFAAFGPNGDTLITTGPDGSVRLWETRSGREITTSDFRHPDEVTFADLSPDGRWLVTACRDGSARLWDRQARSTKSVQLHHHRGVRSARFSPDGRLVVTASDDGLAGLWEVPTGRPHCEMLRHEGPVHSAEFSRDGRHVITASADGTARVWWAATGQLVNEVIRHAGPATRATFSPDGKQVLTASLDGVACVWETTMTDVPAPPWLADLAEGLGGKHWNGGDRFDPVPPGRLAITKDTLNRVDSGDRVTTWARWAADRAHAPTVSPFGDLLVTAFVERCVAETNLMSLRLATQAAPQNALALARLAIQCAQASLWPEAREAGRQAIEVAPEARETWLAWAEVSRNSDGLDPKPHEMLGALEQFPEDPRLWNLRAHLLERANRFDEAVAAYDRVMSLLRAHPEETELNESAVVAARSQLLPRVDQWMSEAVRERRARLGIPERDVEAPANLIDLSAHYTASLAEGPIGAHSEGTKSVACLPFGLTWIEGIHFDIRGLVQLRGNSLVKRLPLDEAGIRVRQSCRRLRFLHGTAGVVPVGTTVSRLKIQRLSGEIFEIPLRYGMDVADWGSESTELAEAKAVIGPEVNGAATDYRNRPRLHLTTWLNPNPDDPVETLDFQSSASGSAPFLVAVTAE